MPTTANRPLPAGCDNQGRHRTRDFCRSPWHDTVATDWSDCAPEGGEHHDPAPTKPDRYGPLLGVILALSGWPLVLAVVALIAALAEYLPRISN